MFQQNFIGSRSSPAEIEVNECESVCDPADENRSVQNQVGSKNPVANKKHGDSSRAGHREIGQFSNKNPETIPRRIRGLSGNKVELN